MELTFSICNQSLKRTDSEKPADYSNEYLKCIFSFESDDWTPMGKFAIFKTGKLNYRVAINDGECIVPFDALQYNQFALTVYGIDGDTRITTNLVYIKLGKSGFVTEYDESSYFNPDMTEELLDMVEQKVYISSAFLLILTECWDVRCRQAGTACRFSASLWRTARLLRLRKRRRRQCRKQLQSAENREYRSALSPHSGCRNEYPAAHAPCRERCFSSR